MLQFIFVPLNKIEWNNTSHIYTYIHVYKDIYTRVYTHIHVCMDIYTHMYTYIYTHMYTYIFTHMYTYIYTHVYTHRMYTCVEFDVYQTLYHRN